jgi:hypothetical protein
MTIKLCVDCKYAILLSGGWFCQHPKTSYRSRVTGLSVPEPCDGLRHPANRECGEIGTLWEAKP